MQASHQTDFLNVLARALLVRLDHIYDRNAEIPVCSVVFTIWKDHKQMIHHVNSSKGSLDSISDCLLQLATSRNFHAKKRWFFMDFHDADDECVLELLSYADNVMCNTYDPTAHSELLAIRAATQIQRQYRIPEMYLMTSLEPCLMCTGAIVLARLKGVYYLCKSNSGLTMTQIFENQYKNLQKKTDLKLGVLNHKPEIVYLSEYQKSVKKVLQNFFINHRRS